MQNGIQRKAAKMMLAAMILVLGGCAGQMRFPISENAQEKLVDQNINVVRITTENISQYRTPVFFSNQTQPANPPGDPAPYTYRIGAGDELRIMVWSNPERTQAVGASGGATGNVEQGIVVNEHGQFFYPFVGAIRGAGRSATEIRADLTKQLRTFIADPQVEVTVSRFSSRKATITGVVETPGPVTITNIPLRLLDVLNQAGIDETGDLANVTIRRRGKGYNVNLKAFVDQGAVRQNPIILDGDVINVPPIRDNKIFTFGEIDTREIPLPSNAPVSLTETLAEVGGIDRIRADSRGIFVFRRTPSTPQGFDVFQFNLKSATALVLATDFKMAPLDIIFVTNDPITRWNDTVGSLVAPLTGLVRVRAVVESN